MKTGDKFTWLHSEVDSNFGEECEAIAVRGNLIDYKFVNRPKWKTATMPIDWATSEKTYSNEEIAAIQKRRKRRRFAEIF